MRRYLIWFSLLCAVMFNGGFGQPPSANGQGAVAEVHLTKSEADACLRRLRAMVVAEHWTFTTKGDDIVIEYYKPVAFSRFQFNMLAPAKPAPQPVRNRKFRLALAFGPHLTQEEYDAKVEQNEASDRQAELLLKKHGLHRAKGEIAIYTEEDKQKKKAYDADVAKLTFYQLPDFYTPDHSMRLYQSWEWYEGLSSGDKDMDEECRMLQDDILKLFGVYDPRVAAGSSAYGRSESSRH